MMYNTLNFLVWRFFLRTQMYFVILLVTLFGVRPALADQDWRCSVDLIFSGDNGGTVANYVLTLQVKNVTGRNVNGVSVIYKNAEKEVIGNTLLKCGLNELPLKPGSYGECRRTIQRVDASFIHAFGAEKWTNLVDSQLQEFNSISYCYILGFSY